VVPEVPLVLPLELALPIWALVRINPADDDELLDELGGVEGDDVPDVPAVLLPLPFWRQPVRVMVALELLWLLDVPLVCAARDAPVKATTTNATTHICLFMLCLLKDTRIVPCNPGTAPTAECGCNSETGRRAQRRQRKIENRAKTSVLTALQ